MTYAVLGKSSLSSNEMGFATATTSTNHHIEGVVASGIVMKRGRQRYETNEPADRCGETEWLGKQEYAWSKGGQAGKRLGFQSTDDVQVHSFLFCPLRLLFWIRSKTTTPMIGSQDPQDLADDLGLKRTCNWHGLHVLVQACVSCGDTDAVTAWSEFSGICLCPRKSRQPNNVT